jgi:hypothetical protein
VLHADHEVTIKESIGELMPGRRTKNVTNPQAHEAWMERKREFNITNVIARQFQKMWRIDCLQARAFAGTITAKNVKEAESLGLRDYSVTPE